MAQLFTTPYQTTLDANGKPISGAQLFFYDTGTLNHRDVYTTAALSTPHPSPIVADAAGRYPAVYLNSAFVYRVIVCDSFGTPIKDVDPYSILDASSLSFIQSGTGAIVRNTQAKLREMVSILDFGATGDPTVANAKTINDAAFAAARAYIATTGAKLNFPPGVYLYTTSPNWAIGGAVIYATGNVTLRLTDTAGHAVLIDGAATDAVNVGSQGVYNLEMTGFKVESQQYSGEPVYVNAAHQSRIRLWVRGGNPAKYGHYISFCVSTDFWLACNALDTGAWYTNGIPLGGVYVTDNGNTTQPASFCNFYNVQVSGPTIGVRLQSSSGNIFWGGAIQGCTDTGLYMAIGAAFNQFHGTDLEANASRDVTCIGLNNDFNQIDTAKLFYMQSGQNNRITGGTHGNITIDAASSANVIEAVRYARPLPNGTASGYVITDNGTRTLRRGNLNLVTQKFDDEFLTEASQTVGASPFTYVNTTAQAVTVGIVGGTVTGVNYNPLNVLNRAMSATTSQVRLRPGDSMNVIFTAAPTIYLYRE